ncbi:hypothetical protein [Flavobacterium piscis]|uniref:Uncharacterized protein n=1 Tax=Flavobacterium piscis TaxID=1114874 RepID=A0ABU1YBQ1_9FLAO|nr:hypothetical protein [Flavobacterium piscis]MDR7211672.1 hypothetical protein [Flavobacterium piscis]
MIDYEKTVQKIIDSITNFSFEFEFEALKKEMELQEVSQAELDKLGENKVKDKFNNGFFKIKMPNGNLIDVETIYKQSIEKNIKEPVLFINPDFKYVKWSVKKNFTLPQIKKYIRNQLTNNTDLNLAEVQKALLIEEVKNKEVEGYLNELPIKTSENISEGKFHIQSSCSRESVIKMVYDTIEELYKDRKVYIESKLRKDYKYVFHYIIFVLFIYLLWFVNKQYETLPFWLSNTISSALFLIPLIVMRLINHSIFDSVLFRKKAEKKYEKEFNNKVN